jgi:serine/threonine protein kinase
LYKKVTQNEEYFKMETHGWEHISKEAKHLVKHMLRGDPKARYTIDQVLTHPWISKNNNSGKILSKTVKNFVRTNARQRFRGAIRAIIMMNRLRALTSCGGKKRKCGKRKRDSVDVRKKKKKKSNGRRMKKK